MLKETIHKLYRTLLVFSMVVSIGGLTTLHCEKTSSDSNIKTQGDALWWAMNVSTVGDSHLYPVTVQGRCVGSFLILFGYTVFAVNVSMITAYVNEELHKTKRKEKNG